MPCTCPGVSPLLRLPRPGLARTSLEDSVVWRARSEDKAKIEHDPAPGHASWSWSCPPKAAARPKPTKPPAQFRGGTAPKASGWTGTKPRARARARPRAQTPASAETRCILAQSFSRDAVHLGTELRQRRGASWHSASAETRCILHRASAEMRCVFGRASAETRCILAQSFGRDAVRLRQSFGRDAVHLGTELRQRCGASSAELRQRRGASWHRASAEMRCVFGRASAEMRCVFGRDEQSFSGDLAHLRQSLGTP